MHCQKIKTLNFYGFPPRVYLCHYLQFNSVWCDIPKYPGSLQTQCSRISASNAVCISHLDGLGMAAAVRKMIDIVVELSASKPFGRYSVPSVGKHWEFHYITQHLGCISCDHNSIYWPPFCQSHDCFEIAQSVWRPTHPIWRPTIYFRGIV